jgi:ParB family chromosome partitioning protein
MFTTQEQRYDVKREKVTDIPLTEIDNFPDHPFQVKMDEAMQAMAESVKAVGIQSPAIVRRKEDGRFELVSGHRRKMACEIAGLEYLQCIVRELSRDEAIIAMVDANLQREIILPSEKAKSYKKRYEAMKRTAGRPSKNSAPVAGNFQGKESAEILGGAVGESKDQVRRYIRLTELIPEILDIVEEGKIAMRPAVELSYTAFHQMFLFWSLIIH